MLGVFLALVFGTVDFSRWLYAIDATTEAARQAVRTAAVCSKEAPGVLRSVEFLPTGASGGTATVSYLPNGCCARQDPNGVCTVCTGVSVRLSGYALDPVSPFLPSSLLTVPPVTTYMSRENMDSADNPNSCS
jgi:hypothetical protein